jgi:hypothetical protein
MKTGLHGAAPPRDPKMEKAGQNTAFFGSDKIARKVVPGVTYCNSPFHSAAGELI